MLSISIAKHYNFIALALHCIGINCSAWRLSSLFSLVFWVGSAFSNYLSQRNSNAHSFLNLHFYIFFQNTYTFYVEHFGNLIQRPVILLYFGWLANMVTRQKKALRLYIFFDRLWINNKNKSVEVTNFTHQETLFWWKLKSK